MRECQPGAGIGRKTRLLESGKHAALEENEVVRDVEAGIHCKDGNRKWVSVNYEVLFTLEMSQAPESIVRGR